MLGKYINHCEDSLTASVFTHLLHLPTELFWRILRNACNDGRLPESVPEPTTVEPWPNWDPQGTRNSDRVIPDLFIRFPQLDLIIEAKRWDGRMQNQEQWKRELIAYANEFGKEERSVKMIAIGGVDPSIPNLELRHQIDGVTLVCPVHVCKWRALLRQCKRVHRENSRLEFPTSHSRSHLRILEDIINLFSWHGFQAGMWFSEFAGDPRRLAFRQDVPSQSWRFQHPNSKSLVL